MNKVSPGADKSPQFPYSKATVILNLVAGGRNALRSQARIREKLKSRACSLEFARTRGKEDAVGLAYEAVMKGSKLVIAIGGDGTVNEVVNGLFKAKEASGRECVLGIIPEGTSCSLARELGIPRHRRGRASVDVVAKGSVRPIDLISLKWTTPTGEQKERLAITVANFGFGGAVVRSAGARMKRLGGFLSFAMAATLQLLRYRSSRMVVKADGTEIARRRILCAITANSRWEGGGMCVAPQARPDDGLLDLIVVEDLPIPSRMRHFPKVYVGKHISLPVVECVRGRRVLVRSGCAIPFEFDGESAECRECSVEVVPKALRVLVPRQVAPPAAGSCAPLSRDGITKLGSDGTGVALSRIEFDGVRVLGVGKGGGLSAIKACFPE